MLTGKTFRLRRRILAMGTEPDGKRVAAWIAAGETFRVLSGPWSDGLRTVDITWQKRTFEIFAVDIEQRCVEVISRTCKRSRIGVRSSYPA
jgi:hypothetical protein